MRQKIMLTTRSRGLDWCRSAKIDAVPVRWSSSERPLSVRTVWVGSVRHAILTLDDPLLQYQGQPCYRRPESSADSSSETSSIENNELEECLVKLRVALDSAKKKRLPPLTKPLPNSPGDPSSYPSPAPASLSQNRLSERVLQWLDLAGKDRSTAQTPLLPKRTRNTSTVDKMVQHKRKFIGARSASVDIPRSSVPRKKTQQSIFKVSIKEPFSALPDTCFKEERIHLERTLQQLPPTPQKYEHSRPMTSWSTNSTNRPSRPQLHIFMPPLEQTFKPSVECVESTS